MATKNTRRYAEAGRRTAEAQRRIQRENAKSTKGTAKSAKAAKGAKKKRAVQPPGQKYPEPPLPKQHQLKPGIEAELEPRPRYEAPGYRGAASSKAGSP